MARWERRKRFRDLCQEKHQALLGALQDIVTQSEETCGTLASEERTSQLAFQHFQTLLLQLKKEIATATGTSGTRSGDDSPDLAERAKAPPLRVVAGADGVKEGLSTSLPRSFLLAYRMASARLDPSEAARIPGVASRSSGPRRKTPRPTSRSAGRLAPDRGAPEAQELSVAGQEQTAVRHSDNVEAPHDPQASVEMLLPRVEPEEAPTAVAPADEPCARFEVLEGSTATEVMKPPGGQDTTELSGRSAEKAVQAFFFSPLASPFFPQGFLVASAYPLEMGEAETASDVTEGASENTQIHGESESEDREQENKEMPFFSPDSTPVQDKGDPRTLAEATSLKLQGNEAFTAGRLADALTYYMDAQKLLLDHELDDDGLDSVLASNSAAVFLKMGDLNRVLCAAESAIEYDPQNVKAYFRGAQAARGLGNVVKSACLCDRGLKLAPREPGLLSLQQCLIRDYHAS